MIAMVSVDDSIVEVLIGAFGDCRGCKGRLVSMVLQRGLVGDGGGGAAEEGDSWLLGM